MRTTMLVVSLIVLPGSALCGNESIVRNVSAGHTTTLTGNITVDFFGRAAAGPGPLVQTEPGTMELPGRKSPWLAAGLSIVVPGTGEIYAESYWKAAAFIVVEAAAWTVAYVQNKKGDRQTDSFQAYADEHWDVTQYASYAQSRYAPPNGPYNWLRTDVPADRPAWERVYWPELNRMERDIGGNASNRTGQYYSHTLPIHGEQQYFELIGKYQQFNPGWDDAVLPYEYGDPLSERFLYYSKERGKANDFYTNASTAVTVAIVNHVLSAADAAWSASMHNRSLHADLGLKRIPLEHARVPTLTLTYAF